MLTNCFETQYIYAASRAYVSRYANTKRRFFSKKQAYLGIMMRVYLSPYFPV